MSCLLFVWIPSLSTAESSWCTHVSAIPENEHTYRNNEIHQNMKFTWLFCEERNLAEWTSADFKEAIVREPMKFNYTTTT